MNTKDEKKERDELICSLYLNGATQDHLATQFGISEAWVGRILSKAGLTREDRPRATKRNAPTGVHLSKGVKEAVRTIATAEGKSMSSWVAGLVAEELTRRGVKPEEENSINDVRLPFVEETTDATAH